MQINEPSISVESLLTKSVSHNLSILQFVGIFVDDAGDKMIENGTRALLSSLVKYADNKYYSFDEELCFLSKAPHRFVLNGISLL